MEIDPKVVATAGNSVAEMPLADSVTPPPEHNPDDGGSPRKHLLVFQFKASQKRKALSLEQSARESIRPVVPADFRES